MGVAEGPGLGWGGWGRLSWLCLVPVRTLCRVSFRGQGEEFCYVGGKAGAREVPGVRGWKRLARGPVPNSPSCSGVAERSLINTVATSVPA